MTKSVSTFHRRVGAFMIDDAFLEAALAGEQAALLASFMSRCIIIRAEHLYVRSCTLYHAFCMDFEEVEDGQDPPLYTVEMSRECEEFSCRFVLAEGSQKKLPESVG